MPIWFDHQEVFFLPVLRRSVWDNQFLRWPGSIIVYSQMYMYIHVIGLEHMQ